MFFQAGLRGNLAFVFAGNFFGCSCSGRHCVLLDAFVDFARRVLHVGPSLYYSFTITKNNNILDR